MPAQHTANVTESGRGDYPYRVSCTCGFTIDRSERALAVGQIESHIHCDLCPTSVYDHDQGHWVYVPTGHCNVPCRQCLGHCDDPCSDCEAHGCQSYCETCDSHCDQNCYDCGGHCQQWCWDYCGGHCAHDDPDCEDCHDYNGHGSRVVHDYGYKPVPVFHGNGPLYVGLELETSWGSGNMPKWLSDYVAPNENIWYAKDDSSVSRGIELVTHPMSTQWALRSPIPQWITAGLNAGAIPDDESCGTHIHISRKGLSGPQWWTIFQVHARLADLCGHIGGRGTRSTWANWEYGRDVLSKPVPAKLAPWTVPSQRYVPVNIQPDDTIELRYPAGDFTPSGFRRNVQWVEALTTFTQGLHGKARLNRITEDGLIGHINRGYYTGKPWAELHDRVRSY
jgi:hypothetical protein